MKYRLAVLAVMFPAVAWAWPWSTDMAAQPAIGPQSPVAEDRMEMYPFPKRSVPVGGVPTTVANREEARDLANPVSVGDASLHQGRNLFKIYCGACHGLTGRADSPVSGKIGAPPLVDNPYIDGADGRGSNDLSVEERWHVVNYIRHGLAKDAQSPVRTAAQ